jgi:hypothetical protein
MFIGCGKAMPNQVPVVNVSPTPVNLPPTQAQVNLEKVEISTKALEKQASYVTVAFITMAVSLGLKDFELTVPKLVSNAVLICLWLASGINAVLAGR